MDTPTEPSSGRPGAGMVRLHIADGVAEVVLDAPYRLNAVDE
jgi:2-(1,2-epoxy-1,2-dihydrophenyl)acetyl-CoA isomerase